MAFCSNCGKELTGIMKYCSHCGYRIKEEERKIINKVADEPEPKHDYKSEAKEKSEPAAPAPAEDSKPVEERYVREQEQTQMNVPLGATVKSKIPKSTTCLICNSKTEDICFFCDYAICTDHCVDMQIFADKAKFGNTIQCCPECADKKKGKQPKKDEAAEIGFFFNIKPYHEWRIIE